MLGYSQESLSFLLKERNVLVFGENSFEHLNPILELFNLALMEEITEYTLQNFSTTLVNNCIDVVIINDKYCNSELDKMLQVVLVEENLSILVCLTPQNSFCDKLINLANGTFCDSISTQQFSKKLFNLLYNQHEHPKSFSDFQNHYVDSIEIEIIFLRDELIYLAQKIDSGDISQEMMVKITTALARINAIYENYLMYSKTIKIVINELEEFLNGVNVKECSNDDCESFEYLARLLEDISGFLDNYFIKRVYDNLYIVEASLENSFQFLKAAFEKQDPKKDGSSLEFFND